MPMVAGSLLAGMQNVSQLGGVIGLLIIDEQGNAATTAAHEQRAVINFASREGHPIWMIELSPVPDAPRRPTTIGLRGMLPPGTPVISKPSFSAFHNTNLHQQLTAQNVTDVVVMGYAANQCVRATACGAFDRPQGKGTFRAGATQAGYRVHTCHDILRGGPASWVGTANVSFYQSAY